MPNIFNNAQTQLSTTNLTDVYQAPSGSGDVAIVLSCIAANVQGTSSADVTITKTNSSNVVQSQILFTVPVPNDTSLEAVSNKLVLKAGEKLRAQASSANFLHITVSVLEITA